METYTPGQIYWFRDPDPSIVEIWPYSDPWVVCRPIYAVHLRPIMFGSISYMCHTARWFYSKRWIHMYINNLIHHLSCVVQVHRWKSYKWWRQMCLLKNWNKNIEMYKENVTELQSYLATLQTNDRLQLRSSVRALRMLWIYVWAHTYKLYVHTYVPYQISSLTLQSR